MNDGISKDLASLSYVSVHDVMAGIIQRGRGTLLAKMDKMDIQQAYWNVPIHASDRPLLDMQWQGAALSTQKTHNSAKKWYLQFCDDKSLFPLVASEKQLCHFVSLLAIQSLCHNTIKSYLAAIRHHHIAEGYRDPHIRNMAKLEQVLKVIKAVRSKGPQ